MKEKRFNVEQAVAEFSSFDRFLIRHRACGAFVDEIVPLSRRHRLKHLSFAFSLPLDLLLDFPKLGFLPVRLQICVSVPVTLAWRRAQGKTKNDWHRSGRPAPRTLDTRNV